ncbi:MAG: hypothetical protein QNJ51_07190 [Calothrix sp. MO_167.B12]|nr:hypothetical protein [Calothrix sp. MO_167.B12]
MLKKSLAFGLLAASLMVAPGAAFAGDTQTQVNDQLTDQSGAALDGSVNVQNSVTRSRQIQKSVTGRGRRGYRYGCSRTGKQTQSQASTQTTGQSGVAANSSTNTQRTGTISRQVQTIRTRALCR